MRNSEGAVLEVSPLLRDNWSQLDKVFETLAVNRWRWMTLNDIAALTGVAKPGSIASRIRDLRADGVRIETRRSDTLSTPREPVYEYMLGF